jgi:hypothetical protein
MIQARSVIASLVLTLIGLVALEATPVLAQRSSITQPSPTLTQEEITIASQAAESSSAAALNATPSAALIGRVVDDKPNITEEQGVVKSQLQQYLLDNPADPLTITNALQHAIRQAVSRGVPANTIVLVLLFPMVAALIAASRHLIGLRGFGIFTPAVLSVAFVATNVVTGILLFGIILFMATLGRKALKRLKLQYLPRMALIMWFVCMGVLAALLIAPLLSLGSLATLSIFPILILVLLAENFIEVQIGKSQSEAMELALETIVLALISSLVLSLNSLQKFALLHPELLVSIIALFDIFMGKYSGLRLTEYIKFKRLQ